MTRPRASSAGTTRVPVINFVRVPLMACALVTVLFLPGIIRQGADSYHRATGQTQQPFLGRWLVLCAVLLLLGALAYLVSVVVARRRPARSEPEAEPVVHVAEPRAVPVSEAVAPPEVTPRHRAEATARPVEPVPEPSPPASQPPARPVVTPVAVGAVALAAVLLLVVARRRRRRR